MASGRASFEVQALRDDNWITEQFCDTEQNARDAAKAIFSRRQCQGIRIIKNWRRADGIVTENVIYTETRAAEDPKVTIVPIQEAAACKTTGDFYRLESRATINRLFRHYIEKVYLTPTELIHSYKALKRVQEVDTLFPAAVDRVATIQARAEGEDPRSRRDEIYKAVAQMTRKAQRAEENTRLPAFKGDDFEKVIARVERVAPPDEVDFYALVVLSRELMEHRSWLGKLERLVELTHPDLREETMSLLDGVIADLLGVPSALQDVLGYQRNLAQALCAIADLCEGRFSAERSDARQQIAVLGPLIAEGRLADTQKSLMERLLRQLSGGQALNRSDPSLEREAFREVAERLFRPEGFLGGPATAEALTRRFVFLQEAGGHAGLRQAVAGVCATVPEVLFVTVYLTQLAATPLGQELLDDVLAQLRHMVEVPDLNALVPPGWPPKDKLLRITHVYDTIVAATALPEEARAELLGRLDQFLTQYIQRQKVIEKLDDPKAALRDRTTRLLEFCAAHVLPPASTAHRMARERIVALLRQPNFDERFVEGIADTQHREEVLRSLHTLLARGGFR